MRGPNIRLPEAFIAIVTLGISMNAFGFLGIGGTSWKEEVLLHDGGTVIVKRSHTRGGRHELAHAPPVREHSVTFRLPGSNDSVTWHDEYSEDVGSANFVLLALHVVNRVPYLIAEPYGCLAFNKWDRPNPPYVIFKYDGQTWQRIQGNRMNDAVVDGRNSR